MSIRTQRYDLYWWLSYYTLEIDNICNRNAFKHELGLPITEEQLQQSNEEIYKNIMYRNNIAALIDKDEQQDDY